MNTEQLLSLVEMLIADDTRVNLPKRLTLLSQALTQLAANPQNPPSQTEVANKLNDLEKSVGQLEEGHSPAFIERMRAIGALPYFCSAMVDRIRQAMVDNPMTPAVVQQEAQKLVEERTAFLDNLRNLKSALEKLGFEEDGLEPGEAEIGFQIPRDAVSRPVEKD